MIGSESLKGRIRNIANSKNLRPQEVLQMFFFERFLERLSKSKYEYSGRFYTACPVMETVDSGMMETAIPEMQNQ